MTARPSTAPGLPGRDNARPSGDPPYWSPGTHIWWRYRREVRPVRVVRDDDDGLVAWLAPRTPVVRSVLIDGRDIRSIPLGPERFAAPRRSKRDVWRGPGILKIAPTGVPWSVWLFWGPDGTFRSWYVNLERTHLRDDRNVYSRDHVLDVVVHHDRRVQRKDEDELAAAVEAGRFDAEQAMQFEQDARSVEKIIAKWGPPFCDGWEHWRPDPGWAAFDLPPDYA